MKSLFKLFVIFALFLCPNLFSQEPVVFHFNFSFERDYISPNNYILTDEIENITVKILNSKKHLKWERNFTNTSLPRDQYGYCLLSDTITNLKSSHKPYSLKVNYKLTSGKDDTCELFFSYPDTVKKLALELFFDQALITKVTEDTIHNITWEEYAVNPNPKPVPIVKHLESEHGLFMSPTWFDYFRITKRPEYILYNNSSTKIFRLNKNLFTCFFGKLQIRDSIGTWQPYFFGGSCGTFNCQDTISPGETYSVVEAYPIGNPRKLIAGYYKYFVQYKDNNGNEKSVSTYFSVVYSK